MTSLGHVTLLLALIGPWSGGVRAQMLYGGMPMGFGGGMGMMGGFGGGIGMGGFGGFGFDDFDDDDDDFDSLRLTCMNNVTDTHSGQVSDAISVTISYGTSGSGYGGGGGFSQDPYGYYGYGSGIGSNRGGGGTLKAEIQILSSGIGRASVVVTERARVEDGCHRETLGAIYSGSSSSGNQGSMYSGFGHMGMGMGMGGMFGGGGDIGLGGNGDGILKEDIKVNVNLQTIYIDSVQGFTRLEDLAGRGIAVCSDSSYGWDWEATCEGPVFMCCALKYDDHDTKINLFDMHASSVTYA